MENEVVVEKSLPHNAGITSGSESIQEALETATMNRSWGIVKLLVESGANINAQFGYFGAALHIAA
jgi:ankyrin repeat protein